MEVKELTKKFPVGDLEHLLDTVEIPVSSGPQAQGDVAWYPVRKGQVEGLKPIAAKGIVIVEGLNGHPHTLFADGECFWAPNTQRGQRLGVAVVPEGSTLIIGHNEHGYSAAGPGQYNFNRSREQRTEIEILAD
jgi:hypothetical protein